MEVLILKKVISICMILMFLLPAQVFAHSKMTVASPEKDAVVDLSPALIMMEFNTDIASISTFVLENEQGEAIPVDQINVEGHKLSGVPVNVLDNGLYNVKWTIIGADGHTVEGNYAFTVNAPEAVEEPVTDDEVEATPEPTPSVEPTVTPSPSPVVEDTNDSSNDEKTSSFGIIVPIVLIVIVIALAAVLANKRNKK